MSANRSWHSMVFEKQKDFDLRRVDHNSSCRVSNKRFSRHQSVSLLVDKAEKVEPKLEDRIESSSLTASESAKSDSSDNVCLLRQWR